MHFHQRPLLQIHARKLVNADSIRVQIECEERARTLDHEAHQALQGVLALWSLKGMFPLDLLATLPCECVPLSSLLSGGRGRRSAYSGRSQHSNKQQENGALAQLEKAQRAKAQQEEDAYDDLLTKYFGGDAEPPGISSRSRQAGGHSSSSTETPESGRLVWSLRTLCNFVYVLELCH